MAFLSGYGFDDEEDYPSESVHEEDDIRPHQDNEYGAGDGGETHHGKVGEEKRENNLDDGQQDTQEKRGKRFALNKK